MANVKMIYMNSESNFEEQECSDPHKFWSGRNCGAEYLAAIPKEQYKARIQTDEDFELYIYEVANVYALRIALKEETIEVSKTFKLDISVQGLVKAAEEEITAVKIVEQGKYTSNIARYRRAYGYTLSELADISGVNRTVINRIELGNQKTVTTRYDTLRKLADALQRTVDEIIDMTEWEKGEK